MAYVIESDGTARALNPDEACGAIAIGQRCFGTIAGAVVHGGVKATAFDGPVKAVGTMPGKEWLETGVFVARFLRAEMKISAENGVLCLPPRPYNSPIGVPLCREVLIQSALIKAWSAAGLGVRDRVIGGLEEAIRLDPDPSSETLTRALTILGSMPEKDRDFVRSYLNLPSHDREGSSLEP